MNETLSFHDWLSGQIGKKLKKKSASPPYIVWCDPNREWLDLLLTAAQSDGFELWADPEKHELLLRDRFFNAPRDPRIIWVGCSRDDITWFKVFELEAEYVWEDGILKCLRDYGVSIKPEDERRLAPAIPAYAKEWFDQPISIWDGITGTDVTGQQLFDKQRMLEVIAGETDEFSKIEADGSFNIFARRTVDDYSLPDPTSMEEKHWRVSATARLLATDAAAKNPQHPPNEGDNVIKAGLTRENALDLLKMWQRDVQFMNAYEQLAPAADKTLGLAEWARNLDTMPRSYSSRAVEEVLIQKETAKLAGISDVNILLAGLEERLKDYQERANGFWEKYASKKIGWSDLVGLAEAAEILIENKGIGSNWRTLTEAIDWYSHRGWMVDQAGESLFMEAPGLSDHVYKTRERLRLGYLRIVDGIGKSFSDLLARHSDELSEKKTAGEQGLSELDRSKEPTALIFIDACSLQFGHRLSTIINQGELEQRAKITSVVAPLPSVTSLGMAFALPMKRDKFSVDIMPANKGFVVTAKGFDGNLVQADQRRKWLESNFGVKDFLKINEVLDSTKLVSTKKPPGLVVVEGSEVDELGHEGQLKLTGAEEHLERYAQAVRRLREAGFQRVIIVTDHGFFHWQPDKDEVEDVKPSGDVLWTTRRAVVGRKLQHHSAISLKVPCSDLEVMVPRSVNAFRTYGGIGYFHGGAMLQELVIPVIVVRWPAKAKKTQVVLKPVANIASESPRVQVQAGAEKLFADTTQLARRVLIKVREATSQKLVFKHLDAVTVEPVAGEPGEPIPVQLELVEPKPTLPYGTKLVVELIDADDEELLQREDVDLKVDIDEW